jgi:hypothetical protein
MAVITLILGKKWWEFDWTVAPNNHCYCQDGRMVAHFLAISPSNELI